MSTIIRHRVQGLLEGARSGRGVTASDVTDLPDPVATAVLSAAARITALAESGQQRGAARERDTSLAEILNAAMAAGIDPAGRVTRTSTPADVRDVVKSTPRR